MKSTYLTNGKKKLGLIGIEISFVKTRKKKQGEQGKPILTCVPRSNWEPGWILRTQTYSYAHTTI